jgi:pimeloyl-ACP methyl ester carboxylesterase
MVKPLYEHHPGPAGAPTVVCVPGVNGGAYMFRGGLPRLLRHFSVVLLNNPGVAGVPLDGTPSIDLLCANVAKVLDHLNLPRVHLVGHSMGGFVSQRLALTAPQRVHRLVLLATSGGGLLTEADLARAMIDLLPSALADRKDLNAQPARATRYAFAPNFPVAHPAEFAAYEALYADHYPGEEATRRHFLCGARFSSWGEAHKITAPTLVVHGKADRIVGVEGGRWLAGQIPGARYWERAGQGHMLMIEAPTLYDRIADFLLGDGDVGVALPPVRLNKAQLAADALWRKSPLTAVAVQALGAVYAYVSGK